MKYCHKCKQNKELEEFAKDGSKKCKYNNKCKQCDIEREHFRKHQKKEFKLMQYPSGTTIPFQYTLGNRLYLNNKSYTGWFHIIGGEFWTEKLPGKFSKKLIQYQKEFPPEPTKSLKVNKGYFVKKINEGFARSVGVNEFEKYKNNPLYKTIEIDKNNPEEIEKAKQLIPETSYFL